MTLFNRIWLLKQYRSSQKTVFSCLTVLSKTHAFLKEKTALRADIQIAAVESVDLSPPVR